MSAEDRLWLSWYRLGTKLVAANIARRGWAGAKGWAKAQVRDAVHVPPHCVRPRPPAIDAILDALGC